MISGSFQTNACTCHSREREERERENKKFSKKGKASHNRPYLISYTDL
jgi:hypothetical protein